MRSSNVSWFPLVFCRSTAHPRQGSYILGHSSSTSLRFIQMLWDLSRKATFVTKELNQLRMDIKTTCSNPPPRYAPLATSIQPALSATGKATARPFGRPADCRQPSPPNYCTLTGHGGQSSRIDGRACSGGLNVSPALPLSADIALAFC